MQTKQWVFINRLIRGTKDRKLCHRIGIQLMANKSQILMCIRVSESFDSFRNSIVTTDEIKTLWNRGMRTILRDISHKWVQLLLLIVRPFS